MLTANDVSRAARAQSAPRASADRTAILDFIRQRGVDGATCDEAELHLGLPHQTCSARFHDLKDDRRGTRRPDIEPSGEVRKTRTGARAIVYVVTRGAQ